MKIQHLFGIIVIVKKLSLQSKIFKIEVFY